MQTDHCLWQQNIKAVLLSETTLCFLFLFLFRDSSKKWQEKAALLTQLESQVMRLKENSDSKERLLMEERDKAREAHKYATPVSLQIFLLLFWACV